MDFVTIAFAETGAPHVEDGRAALAAAGAVELWRGLWIMEGRCGALETQNKLASVQRIFAYPPHLPPGIVVSPLDERCEIGIGLDMTEEARVFYHRHVAAAYESKRGRSNRAAFTFFGAGRERFATLVARTDRTLDPPRDVTPRCRAMLRHGSDKSLGWHTYTPFYALLVAALPRPPRHLLEIGIGTNFDDVPSTMGRNGRPGASLRGWRDVLPMAQLFGADVDRRILFEEERIRTFFVDQLSPTSLDRLWSQLPQAPFELIVDDGLHEFEAAANTMAASLLHLDEQGFYVVEDVSVSDVAAYVSLAERLGLDGFVLELPHAVNAIDNCLLVAARPLQPGGTDEAPR